MLLSLLVMYVIERFSMDKDVNDLFLDNDGVLMCCLLLLLCLSGELLLLMLVLLIGVMLFEC
jgi:hypothetical protein